MAIDKSSSEFLFGQIMARLNEGDKVMQRLSDSVDEVTKAVNRLPCDVHAQRLDDLNKREPSNRQKKNNAITAGIAIGITAAMSALLKKLGW